MKLNFIPILLLFALFSFWSTSLKGQCAEPSSYNFETKSDGNWSDPSTWLGGSAPGINLGNKQSVLITHKVNHPVSVSTAEESRWIIKDGGSLTVNSIDVRKDAALRMNNGTLIVTTGNFKISKDSYFCAYESCVDVESTIEFVKDARQLAINNSGLKAGTDILYKVAVTGSNIKLYAGNNITRSSEGSWAASTIIGYYAGGTAFGFSGTLPAMSGSNFQVCVPTSDLKVLQTVDNASAPVGSTLTFTITASNLDGVIETNAKVQDLLPNGFTYVSHTASKGTYNNGTGLWTIGSLDAAESETLSIKALFVSGATNTATISGDVVDSDETNNTSSVTVTLGPCTSPAISVQPVVTQNVVEGSVPQALEVSVSGIGPLTYQWYRNSTNSNVGGTLISGAITDIYTPSTDFLDTTYYYVTVSGFCAPSATSDVSKVIVRESYCLTGCNDNTFSNSVDPNTIEYDNIVGLYHSTMIKRSDQKIFVWGQNSSPNGSSNATTPLEVSPANGFNYTGTILKFTGAEYGQFAVLTTTGLYVWGVRGILISTAIKNDAAFSAVSIGTEGLSGTKADGLPDGVSPADVKMLFGSKYTLGLTTCDGQAWVLSTFGVKYGDNSGSENTARGRVWHRVKTGVGSSDFLTNVVAMRGTPNAMIALTSEGKVYTWGSNTYLGDGSNASARAYATEMTLPAGVRVKMIGMTPSLLLNSYYILSTTGSLYSLGNNSKRQLGDFSTTERKSWVQVHKPTSVLGGSTDSGTFMEDITWFSPQEHDNRYAAISALSAAGKLYSWGDNSFQMLGTAITNMNPTYMPGNLGIDDELLAVETGGHISITFKKCSVKYGYVGHRSKGSMGDGTTADAQENTYNFDQTADFNLCGAPTAPSVKDLMICPNTTENLVNAELSSPFFGTTVEWYTTPNRAPGTQVLETDIVGPGTYYAFYVGDCPNPAQSVPVVISEYLPGSPEYRSCSCFEAKVTNGTNYPSLQGITSLSRTGSEYNTWLTSSQSAWTVLEAKTKGFVINRVKFNSNNKPVADNGVTLVITSPVEGMMVYDVTNDCLKLYTSTDGGLTFDWFCIVKQGCPE